MNVDAWHSGSSLTDKAPPLGTYNNQEASLEKFCPNRIPNFLLAHLNIFYDVHLHTSTVRLRTSQGSNETEVCPRLLKHKEYRGYDPVLSETGACNIESVKLNAIDVNSNDT